MVKQGMHLLALAVMLLALLPGWAQAQGASPQVLAQFFFSGSLQALPLPVLAHWQSATGLEVVLVIAPLADVQHTGLPFRVLDAEAQPGAYYLAHRRPERLTALRPDALDIGRSLLVDGPRLLVRATPAQAEHLLPLGFELQWLGDAPVSLTLAPVVTATALAHDETLVGEILAQVLERTLYSSVSGLSGETAVIVGGAPYTMTTRYTNSGTPIAKATQYAYEQLQALGLSVSYHPWTRSGYNNRNVIGVIPGTTHADEIVLITAHLDSTSNAPGVNPAPGADDNASGSAAVLLAADILSRYDLDRTVRFVLFTGEEQGLLGSYEYATTVYNAGDNIVAVYNMDMLAWDALSGPDLDLFTRTTSNPGYAGDMVIANTFTSIVNTYALDLTPNIRSTGMGSSDHYPFWQRGFPAILAIEDYTGGDFNDHYHTTNDLLQYFNMPYYVDFAKASVGTATRLAGVTRRYPFEIATLATPGSVTAGELFTYTVLLTNTARSATTGMVVRTELPADVTFLSASDGGALEGEAVFWRNMTLPVGATLPLTVRMRAGCVPSGTLLAGGATQATALGWPVAATGAPVTVTTTAFVPEAAFNFPEPVIRAQPVAFTNLSQNADAFLWNFGDGVTTTVTSPDHTYATTGIVTATLTASNSCFSNTVAHHLVVGDYGVLLAPELSERMVAPGASVTHTLWLTNTGTITDTYTLSLSGGGWPSVLSAAEAGPLAPWTTVMIVVEVTAPLTALPGYADTLLLTAVSQQDPQAQFATAQLHTRALAVIYLPLLLCDVEPPVAE
ncbi:MAG: M28 family peptidase [Anaerolineae bacterium]|nr:M28 family peptidase [Anaerolineae bacterium]